MIFHQSHLHGVGFGSVGSPADQALLALDGAAAWACGPDQHKVVILGPVIDPIAIGGATIASSLHRVEVVAFPHRVREVLELGLGQQEGQQAGQDRAAAESQERHQLWVFSVDVLAL